MTLTEFHELAVSVCRKYMPEIESRRVSVIAMIDYDIITYSVRVTDNFYGCHTGLFSSSSSALSVLEAELQKRNTLNNISKQQEDIKID